VGGFDVVSNNGQVSALVLKRFGNRIQLLLDRCNLLVNVNHFRLRLVHRRSSLGIELLVFGTLFDLCFGLACLRFDALEIARVAANELLLDSLPGSLTKGLIPQGPGKRDREQQCANQHPTARRLTHDRITCRQLRLSLY
jgi:hypothetical protein